ncbi:MAG: methionyl-tRNA formyltransferase [Clostridia bacterium]|nr:methionyl-tRNA formyltransferase [Clostridia bacterium]
MGTPDFAAGCLKALLDHGHEVVGVFSQPDKPKGRKQVLTPPPVKELAESQGLPVYQPKSLKDGEAMKIIESLAPEIIVVVAYGKILPKEILCFPPHGCINIHASLLPRLRGAAPINFAIIEGDETTGITSMYMDEGLDTGDMLIRRETQIDPDMTAGELFIKLSDMGADVLIETLDAISAGTLVRTPQDDDKATYAPIMTKETGKIDFSLPAKRVHDLVRGTDPWPGAYCTWDEKMLKICKTVVTTGGGGKCGEVIYADKTRGIVVSCGENCVRIEQLQLQGKKRMSARDFLNGNKLKPGDILM